MTSLSSWLAVREALLADPVAQADLWRIDDPAAFRGRLTALGAPPEGPWPWAAGPIRLPGVGAPPLAAPPAGPGWVPAHLETLLGPPLLGWLHAGDRRGLSSPFYAMDMQALAAHPLNQFLSVRTGLDALPPATSPAPAGLIFHMSRCGSTLAGNMLAAIPGVVVLSEPQPVGAISRAAASLHQRAEALRRLVAAIAEGLDGGQVVLKLEARAILDLEVFREAFPDTPWIFLHRDPVDILASHRAMTGPEMMPGAMDWGLTAPAGAASPDEYRARVLGRICAAAAEGVAGHDGLMIAWRDLPDAVRAIARHFGLSIPPAARAELMARAGRDAKRPGVVFDRQADARRGEADPALRALADRWTGAAYRQMVDTGRLAAANHRPPMEPVLKLPMVFGAARLRAELAGVVESDWVPHFNRGYYEGDWSALPLRSSDGGVRRSAPGGADVETFYDTPHLTRFPYVREILGSLPMPLRSVRLLRLGAGSSILEHTDEYLGYGDGLVRFHIPIVTSPLVEFWVAGQRLDMAEGEVWYIDFNNPHSVLNRADIDRVHLVIDGVVNAWVEDVFADVLAGRGDPKQG